MAAEDYIDLCWDFEDVCGPSGAGYGTDVSNPEDAWAEGHLSCQGHPTRRVNRQTGAPFWGCTNFPKCRHTIPYEDGDKRWEVK